MFGHILRSCENTPAQLALSFAIESEEELKGRLGRPRLNLFSLLVNDLKMRNLSMNDFDELNEIKDIAKCKKCWNHLFLGNRLQN